MLRPIEKICFLNRKRMSLALQRLLDAGEESIVVHIEASPEKANATDAGPAESSIVLTDLEAEAVAESLRGPSKRRKYSTLHQLLRYEPKSC
jgi:hypothetical protein